MTEEWINFRNEKVTAPLKVSILLSLFARKSSRISVTKKLRPH